MVVWPTVCRPTDLDELGIPDLHLTGIALQMRWLWLRHTDEQCAWAELPISASKDVKAFFEMSTYTIIGNGHSTAFWTGRWLQGQAIKDLAPTLIGFVSRRNIADTTVASGLLNQAWVRQITGGIIVPATYEYLQVWDMVSQIQLNDIDDRLVWRWIADGNYTSKLAYRALLVASHLIPGCKRVWKA